MTPIVITNPDGSKSIVLTTLNLSDAQEKLTDDQQTLSSLQSQVIAAQAAVDQDNAYITTLTTSNP